MRRTFQDLARAAKVRDIVTRAVSGHATESMQRHYSTVHGDEVREGIARVVSLARFREAMGGKGVEGAARSGTSGVQGGVHGGFEADPVDKASGEG